MNETDAFLLSGKILEIMGRILSGETAPLPDLTAFLSAVRHYESVTPAVVDLEGFTQRLTALQTRGLICPGDLAAGYGLTREGERSARALIDARDNDDEPGNVCYLRID